MNSPTLNQLKIYFLSCLILVSLFGLAFVPLSTTMRPIAVHAADDIGLNNGDLLQLQAFVAVPQYVLKSFKEGIDANIGKFDILEGSSSFESLGNSAGYASFYALALPLLVVMILWEMVKVLLGKTKIQRFLSNFLTALVMPTAYLAIMALVLSIASLLISALTVYDASGSKSFTDSVIGNMSYFIASANSSIEQQSIEQRTLGNLGGLIRFVFPVANAVSIALNPAVEQYKMVTQGVAWGYFFMAVLNWFSMFIVDWYLKILIFISPIVALSHINGWGNGFVRKFWAGFVDCIVAKVAFHLAYFMITIAVRTQLDTNFKGVNLGFGMFCIASFFALGVITLKVRELFAFIENSYSPIEMTNTTPIHAVQNVAGSTVNFGATAIRTISSFKSLK
jgi:hypothetical protein